MPDRLDYATPQRRQAWDLSGCAVVGLALVFGVAVGAVLLLGAVVAYIVAPR